MRPLHRLQLHLLGAPYLESDGTLIALPTRKVMALLAYLAVTGQAHSRHTLAALLWPESNPAQARGSLRHALAALNRAFGDRWLQADGETVSLRSDVPLIVDVLTFRELLRACRGHAHPVGMACVLCAALLAEAAILYRGDFLAGFSLNDSPDFDEWLFFQAERLHGELAGVLERLVKWYILQHAWDEAVAVAQRWVALDPLREEAQRRLMEVYTWAGRRSAALRQFRKYATLVAEINAHPEAETIRLYELIKAGRLPAPPDSTD